jgi:hypothetical protein
MTKSVLPQTMATPKIKLTFENLNCFEVLIVLLLTKLMRMTSKEYFDQI